MNDRTPVSTSIAKLENPLPAALSSNENDTESPSASVAVTVPIAVWFSAAVNVADDVTVGASFASVIVTEMSWRVSAVPSETTIVIGPYESSVS